MILNKEELALHDKMVEKLPELIKDYFTRPEVMSIGVSLKTVNNQHLNRLSYTFGIKKKSLLSQLNNAIPDTIFGYPTDIIEFDIQPKRLASPNLIIEASRNEKTDPLIGGISISANGEIIHGGKKIAGNGTLGVMVNKTGDDRPYLITCAHVLAGTGTKLDSYVCQQSKWETNLDYCHDCASLNSYYYENVSFERNSVVVNAWLDCAIARKGWFRAATIGKVYGVANIIQGFAVIDSNIIGKEVIKSGITTEITTGLITSITTSLRLDDFDGKEVIANNLIMVKGKIGRFSDSGDSGSVVFTTDDSMMIGVLGGSTVSGDQTFISPIDAILSKWPDLKFKS